MNFEFYTSISEWEWVIVFICAMLIGMAKAGVAGTGMAVVPLLAYVYGSKISVGFLLPILIMADIFAVIYYNRHAKWNYIAKLMPWALAGVIFGVYIGDQISEDFFTDLLSAIILAGVAVMVVRDVKKIDHVPDYWWVSAVLGFAGGFTTMIGNAAGPIMSLYLLSMKLPKNNFIGTAAWFFFIINIFKVPFHIWGWHTITLGSFGFNLILFPVILLGVFGGILIVKRISDKYYRYLVLFTIILSVLFLFIRK